MFRSAAPAFIGRLLVPTTAVVGDAQASNGGAASAMVTVSVAGGAAVVL